MRHLRQNDLLANDEPVKVKKLSLRQKKLVNATVDWVISSIRSKLDTATYEQQLSDFHVSLTTFLEERLLRLDCANIRTTDSDSPFIQLAQSNGIPSKFLPKDVSIVITSSSAYCAKKGGSKKVILEL